MHIPVCNNSMARGIDKLLC